MSEKIVIELLHRNNFLNEGRQVTIDNWFCSVRFAQYLLQKNTLVVGTIRANRVPESLRSFKMHSIATQFVRNNDILIAKFAVKREIYLLSTVHVASLIEKSRRVRGGDEVAFTKPTIVDDYNKTMDGTDKVDAMQHPICCVRKNYVWHKKL